MLNFFLFSEYIYWCFVYLVLGGMTRHATARFVYEITASADLPMHIFGCAMMIYHGFMEYTKSEESLIIGITCMTVAVKFNENYLNSFTSLFKHRSSLVVDAAARVLLSYAKEADECSTEALTSVKREVQESVNAMELSVLKIIGNFGGSMKTAFSKDCDEGYLVEVYSNPICLNYPPGKLLSSDEVRKAVSKYL